MKKMWKFLLFLPLLAFMVACDDDDTTDMEPDAPTIAEALNSTADLSTLDAAVAAVNGLEAQLLAANEITVFAPNNAAFEDALEAFDAADLNELVSAIGGVDNLETVLGYHVVADVAFAADLSNSQSLPTLAGQNLTVNVSGSSVSVTDVSGNTFNVVTADIEVQNGVVHVIDGVLLPELPEEEVPTIADALENTEDLSLLNQAVAAVEGLGTALLGQEAITVFAPSNAAFENLLGDRTLPELITELGGIEKLDSILGFHVVPATAFAADLADGDQTFTTLIGQDIIVNKSADGVTVTDANGNTYNVEQADVEIANGVVHIIEGVLMPELDYPNVVQAATSAGLSTLIDAVTAAELGATLTGAEAITVFAPTDAAFAGLLDRYDAETLDELITILGPETVSNVLQFHVIPSVIFSHDIAEGEQTVETLEGQSLTINKSADGTVTITDYLNFAYTVQTADVVIDNGVVHVIDGVLLPDVSEEPNIVEAATEAGLTTLLEAVTVANLGNTLLQATEITVFAPDNDAFADLLNGRTLDELVTDLGGIENLQTVLGFHVVPTVAFSTDLDEGENIVTTLAGQNLTVTRTGSAVSVTDATGETYNVKTANVTIENGVVHVIDGVLLPDLE
ncbi:fasciclin [Marivirga lumbricoides]|uniref:Fasciclin n=1 Tax=Marivirga lumbricoides TaxID=1046115 RepID=A0A2T4DMR0_9BACT|nr:fasciclin [Marivirga lumbricoides]